MKNELWIGSDTKGLRLAVRRAPSGEIKVSVRATDCPRQEAWLSREECLRILSFSFADDADLRFHPEGFGLLSFDVYRDYLGIDHHLYYRWSDAERDCVLAFLRMFVHGSNCERAETPGREDVKRRRLRSGRITEEAKKQENNSIIDHLEAALEIVKFKCVRCGGVSCMGCCLDSFDEGMVPANIERAIDRMSGMSNDRGEIVRMASQSVSKREAEWRKIMNEGSGDDKETPAEE